MFTLKLNETCFGRDWATLYCNISQKKKKTRFDKRQKKPSEVISNYFGDPKKMIRHYGLKLQVC